MSDEITPEQLDEWQALLDAAGDCDHDKRGGESHCFKFADVPKRNTWNPFEPSCSKCGRKIGDIVRMERTARTATPLLLARVREQDEMLEGLRHNIKILVSQGGMLTEEECAAGMRRRPPTVEIPPHKAAECHTFLIEDDRDRYVMVLNKSGGTIRLTPPTIP